MSISFVENETKHVDFSLRPVVTVGIQIWIVTVERNTEIPVPNVKVYLDTEFLGITNAKGELGPFEVSSGDYVLLCTKEGYRDTRWSINVARPSKYIVDMERISPPEGVYTCSVYYCYLQGCENSPKRAEWDPNWNENCRYWSSYELNLMAAYIRSQGLEASMPILSIEKLEVPLSYLGYQGVSMLLNNALFYREIVKNLPSFPTADIHILLGEYNFQMPSQSFGDTVSTRTSILMQEIRAMEGESGYEDRVYCEFAHELGHSFGIIAHCNNVPCPMAQMQITYTDWVNMGKVLWFCNTCRPILLDSWKARKLL